MALDLNFIFVNFNQDFYFNDTWIVIITIIFIYHYSMNFKVFNYHPKIQKRQIFKIDCVKVENRCFYLTYFG